MSILLFPPPDTDDKLQAEELPTISPLSAFFYFITATLVSMIAFIGTAALKRRHRTPGVSVNTEDNSVPFFVLQHKLGYLAFTAFFTFTVTMIFPVFTQVNSMATPKICYQRLKYTGYCFRPPNRRSVPFLPARCIHPVVICDLEHWGPGGASFMCISIL